MAAVLMLSACTKAIDVPAEQFEAASKDNSNTYRIRLKRNAEYRVQQFALTDSTVVISMLSPADQSYKTTPLPLVLSRDEIESIARTESSNVVPLVVVGATFTMIILLQLWFGGYGGLN